MGGVGEGAHGVFMLSPHLPSLPLSQQSSYSNVDLPTGEAAGGLRYLVLDDSPTCKTAEFGPPRGFGASQAGFRWVNEQRWDTHARSMWSCLYRAGVNAARARAGLGPDARELGPWAAVSHAEGSVPVLQVGGVARSRQPSSPPAPPENPLHSLTPP